MIVPAAMRPDMLKRIHRSHLGIEKCARDVIFWPGMGARVEDNGILLCNMLHLPAE